MTTRDGGKGDRQRPLSIPKEQFESNWDTIFKNKLADKLVKQIEQNIKQANKDYELDTYLCPNCVSPWKCNGPHILEDGQ